MKLLLRRTLVLLNREWSGVNGECLSTHNEVLTKKFNYLKPVLKYSTCFYPVSVFFEFRKVVLMVFEK